MKYVAKISSYLLIISILMVLPACWPFGNNAGAETFSDLVVINVLDRELYEDCHIPGSINVAMGDVASFAREKIDKDAEVVFYCSNYRCSASGFARKKLVELGFEPEKLFVYEGGMADWYQQGLPCVGKAEKSYLQKRLVGPKNRESFDLTAQQLKEKIDKSTLK